MYMIFFMSIGIFTLQLLIFINLRKFSNENSFLVINDLKYSHPALGRNIGNLLSNKEECLVVFAMPNCSSCHPQLEKLIQLNNTDGGIPSTIFLIREHEGNEIFINHYKEYFNIKIISNEVIEDFIDSFPTILFVDTNGEIKEEFDNTSQAYNFLKSRLKEKEVS